MNQPAPRFLKPLLVLGLSVALAACGGGDASPPPTPLSTSGFVVDGYVAGAAVLCDSNGDGLVTPGEVTVNSTSAGLFVFPNGCSAPLVATGGTNADTGLPFVGTVRAPAGSKVITPLTTLVAAGLDAAALTAALGLPEGTDLLNTDPAATDGAGTLLNPALMKRTLAVQQLLQKTAEMLNGLTAAPDGATLPAIYAEVAQGFADYLKGGGRLNASETAVDVGIVGELVRAATLRVRDGSALPAAVRDAAKGVSADALAGVTAGSLKIQADALLNGGNAANLTEVARVQQSDTQITAYVATNKSALAGSPTAETVSSMRQTLTQQVATSQGSGGNGGGGGDGGGGGSSSGGTVLITWDESATPVSAMGAYGDGAPSVDPAPGGASGKALKLARSGAQTFGGTFFTITPAVPFTADRKTITARVYSSRAGAAIRLKVEATDGSSVEVTATPNVSAANTWQTLSWNLSGVNPSKSYTVIAISPDVDVASLGAQSYWIEDVTLAAASSGGSGGTGGGSGGSGGTSGTALITWDESTSPVSAMGAYGDGAPSVDPAPGGTSGKALKLARSGAQTFGGTYFTITPAIPFAADRKTISARVYSSRAGAVIKLKVEATDGSSVEVAATPNVSAANTWQTLSWNLSGVDPSKSYTIIAISPDVDVASLGAQTYWIEDITLAAATGGVSGGGGGGGSNTALITWDEGTSPVSAMGAYGDGAPSVDPAPSGGNGKALKLSRSGGQTFGGTYFTITPAIAFAADRKTITARVYSSRAGAVIKLKVEATDTSSVEVAATQSVTSANTWQTLTWNLSGVDPAKSYTVIAISPDVDVPSLGAQTYWLDDITLAAASGGGGGGGSSTLSFSSGFAQNSLTVENGAFGGFAGSNFDGYFCSGADPAACGGGGDFATNVAAADSYYFHYVQTPSPAAGLYVGVYVMAPGVSGLSGSTDTPGVQITSQTSITFTFGQNQQWFDSSSKNFMVNLDLGKLYLIGGNACHLQLRKVIAPTAAAATSYTVALSSFSVVQDCGTGLAPTAVAAALAASPVSQISFQAAGGASAVPQGGLTTGANLSVPTGSPAVYPTTVVVKGAITFQ